MDGKIAFEEHFAVEETLAHFAAPARGDDPWQEVRRRLLDFHDERLAAMDAGGIELAILSLAPPAIQAIPDIARAVETARASNDRLAEEVARRPDRFAGFAALPMQDPDAAIVELRRCVSELGFTGALVNGFSQKGEANSAIYYDLPEYRPFWQAVAALDVPFYLHPRLNIPSRARAYDGHPWLYAPPWDFAVQTADHAMRLICSGLFDEFPDLQIVLGHLGERIPFDLWRIDNLMEKLPDGRPTRQPVSAYLRANFHLTTSGQFHDAPFRCALAELGAGRILFSVDYPFEEPVEAAAWFDATELSATDRLKIGRGNAIKLFKLDLD